MPHKLKCKSNTNIRRLLKIFSRTFKKQKKLNKGEKTNLGVVVNIREVKSWQKLNESIPSLTHFPFILFLLTPESAI